MILPRWFAGALIGAAAGTLMVHMGGPRARRAARRSEPFSPAVTWGLVGALVGVATNTAEGLPMLNGVNR